MEWAWLARCGTLKDTMKVEKRYSVYTLLVLLIFAAALVMRAIPRTKLGSPRDKILLVIARTSGFLSVEDLLNVGTTLRFGYRSFQTLADYVLLRWISLLKLLFNSGIRLNEN